MRNKILLIDDDFLPMQYYVSKLNKEGWEVIHLKDADKALEYLIQASNVNSNDIALVLLDVMLPYGKKYTSEETEEGLKTGIFLLEDIRRYLGDEVPIIILTNVKNPEILILFNRYPDVVVLSKLEYPPNELAALVHSKI